MEESSRRKKRWQGSPQMKRNTAGESKDITQKNLEALMLRALNSDADVEDTEKILNEMDIREGDEVTMCELFDQYTRKGLQEGRQEGLLAGRLEGEASQLIRNIENVMKNLHITLEEACEALGTTVKSYEDAKEIFR